MIDSQEIFGLSDTSLTLLQELIHQRTGLTFFDGKQSLLAEKLAGRIIERGFSNYLDYYYLLKYDTQAEEEWREVLNRLSVPETYFWREFDQIRILVNVIVPAYFAQKKAGPLRIWSAACASGEEPLTLAMALKEAGHLDRYPIEIVASDGSGQAIQRAQAGLYSKRSFRSIPQEIWDRYFSPVGDRWQIDPAVHGRVQWHTANLMDASQIDPLARSHMIFCRNVFIYFSDTAIRQTVEQFAAQMLAPGYLFVGVSESLLRLPVPFALEEIQGAFIYRSQVQA